MKPKQDMCTSRGRKSGKVKEVQEEVRKASNQNKKVRHQNNFIFTTNQNVLIVLFSTWCLMIRGPTDVWINKAAEEYSSTFSPSHIPTKKT